MDIKKNKNQEILKLLKKHYPHAKIILKYSTPWELLVAIILSAQCTDVTVNKVTSKLFPKFRNLKFKMQNSKLQFKIKKLTPEIQEIINFADVPIEELEQGIRSTGFYRNKAKNIKAAARLIRNNYKGEIPKTMTEMLQIPGVARKTANVFLGNVYGVVEGIAVDTHVKRLSERLGFSQNTDPNKVEQDLMTLFDKKDWFNLTYLLIEHGRAICQAKKPACDKCFLSELCPSSFQFPQFQK